MNEKKYDLMVFGEPMVQYAISGDDAATAKLEKPSVGGEDVFVSATVAAHGFLSGFYSVIAQDPYENMIRGALEKHKIDTEYCFSGKEGFNGIEIVSDKDNERREFFYNRPPGFVNPVISGRADKELIDDCKMIYASSAFTLSSNESRSMIFESFHYAHYHGISVGFDPNIRLHRHNLPQLRETVWMLMPFIDFFSMSAASGEMQSLFGKDNPVEVALDLLEKNVQYTVIRNGGENVVFAYKNETNGKPTWMEIPVAKIKKGYFSYSGAVFNGGFISAILNEETPVAAINYAVKCAEQKCLVGNTLDKFFLADSK